MPPPFSQGWVENIRTLARAGWYDGISVNRVQDNYVVQWGDPNVDNPEAEGEAKPLPEGLRVMDEKDYATSLRQLTDNTITRVSGIRVSQHGAQLSSINFIQERDFDPSLIQEMPKSTVRPERAKSTLELLHTTDSYAKWVQFYDGWPISSNFDMFFPTHCYSMVGVGRSFSPDTGTGAELYTVIGHAPRHLDRNIALVGRVVEGIEHLSSLPRGKGALGFYEDADKRVPIESIRVAGDLPAGEQPSFEYLSTDSEVFARYADARANRRDPFFIEPAGGADICNIPVPVRRISE